MKMSKNLANLANFVTATRRVVVGTSSAPKALKKLCSKLGFSTHKVSKSGHYRLMHPLFGGRSIPFGSSPSDCRWQLAFIQQVRSAIRANPQAMMIAANFKF